jgi:5-methylcytosine-specific restriction endonuclease McrBC regulatory subunit McrC
MDGSCTGRQVILSDRGRKEGKPRFQTRPDLLIEREQQIVIIIDTKWKRIGRHPEDASHGVSQSDVYQMMAYARLYHCPQVMLSIHIMQVWERNL